MTYPQVLRYLNSFPNYEKNLNYSYQKALKLKRIKDFLSLIGDPQKSLRVIHVAGTKGKGSTCAFVAYILRQAGFCAGLYTSPHLYDFRERIRILKPGGRKTTKGFEGMIPAKELSALVDELKPLINKYNRQSQAGGLTFFEVYTALALLYFKRKEPDFVVLETGLGGSLDATNAVGSLACGITPISFEHVQKLGKTLTKIAGEKCGIIKSKGALVVSAAQSKEAREVIRKRCKKFKAKLFELGRQIKYFKTRHGFTVKGLRRDYRNLRLRLFGDHQMANASLAVGLVEALNSFGFNIGPAAIRQGLYNTAWPGRCELVAGKPGIVLDGAQNLASADALKQAVKKFKYDKLILVLGVSADKDIRGISKALEPLADQIILTRADTPRAMDPEKLAPYFKKKVYLTPSVKEAKLLAKRLAHKEDLILVTGSLFVVGEF